MAKGETEGSMKKQVIFYCFASSVSLQNSTYGANDKLKFQARIINLL
jgi:hypothetical protein